MYHEHDTLTFDDRERCQWLARCTNDATHRAYAGVSAGTLWACDTCDPTEAQLEASDRAAVRAFGLALEAEESRLTD